MLRSALPSCLLIAAALAACGKSTGAKFPQVDIPAPTGWDGTPAPAGTVSFISTLPGDDSQFVDYEVDPAKRTVRRTIVGDMDTLKKLIATTLTDPKSNAGTLSVVVRPPPPPPDGQDLVNRAIQIDDAANGGQPRNRQPGGSRSPTH
jgi:hypothetical protein